MVSSPVVGDLDNDGSLDIVVGLVYSSDIFPDDRYGGLYVFDKSGQLLNGWPRLLGYNFVSTPSLFDLDGDGDLEIGVSRLGSVTYMLDHQGNILSGWPQYSGWNDYYSSVFGSIDNGDFGLVTTAGSFIVNGGVYAWDIQGNSLEGFPKMTEVDVQGPAVIGDVDDDNKIEVVASSDWDYDPLTWQSKSRGSLYVWETQSDFNEEKQEWPMFHHDKQLTGCYDCEQIIIEPQCSDNLDNDNDGFVDYSRSIPAGCEWAEHDGDGSFDEDDIEDFYLCFNNTAQAPPECLWADIAPKPNGDGIVDLDDFAELALCTNPLPDGFSPIPDRACSSAGDDDEDTTVFECGDGIDNDGDGLIDMDDQPNCVTVQDNTEDYPFPACDGFEFGGYCWFEGAQGESCDTVCQNIGKTCIQEDWNDDTSCTVCKHFHAGAGCAVQTGVYMPSYSPNMCRYRDDISNQICNMAPPAYQRQCACA